jgi:hypothetical protein
MRACLRGRACVCHWQVHILIFVVAITHVVLGCSAVLISQRLVNSWSRLDYYRYRPPYKAPRFVPCTRRALRCWSWRGCCCLRRTVRPLRLRQPPAQSLLRSLWAQVVGVVNPSVYLALRNFFLRKHGLPGSFLFGRFILRCTQKDLTRLFGIKSMWLIVILDLLEDGYGFARNIPTAFAALAAVALGVKLHRVAWLLTRENFGRHDVDNSHVLDDSEVSRLHAPSRRIPGGHDAAPHPATHTLGDQLFWFNRPKLLLTLLRLVMFIST